MKTEIERERKKKTKNVYMNTMNLNSSLMFEQVIRAKNKKKKILLTFLFFQVFNTKLTAY